MCFKVFYINGLIILKIIQRDSESIYNHLFFNYSKSHHQIVIELGQIRTTTTTTTNPPKGSGLYFLTTHSPKQEKQQIITQLMIQLGISNILVEKKFKLNNKFFKCFELFSSISLSDLNLCIYYIIKQKLLLEIGPTMPALHHCGVSRVALDFIGVLATVMVKELINCSLMLTCYLQNPSDKVAHTTLTIHAVVGYQC